MVGFEQYINLSGFSGHCSGWCGDVVVQNNGVLDSLGKLGDLIIVKYTIRPVTRPSKSRYTYVNEIALVSN